MRKLPGDFDRESVYVSLIRSRKIIDAYNDIVQGTYKESPHVLESLAAYLLQQDKELRQGQHKIDLDLRNCNPIDRKPSFKEIHDEIEMLMMEHKEELVTQDPDLFKSVTMGENIDALAQAYDEVSRLSASAQIAKVLNRLIEGYFEREFRSSADNQLIADTMKKHEQPLGRTLKVIAALKEAESSRLRGNVVMMLELLQLGEEEEFVSTMAQLFP